MADIIFAVRREQRYVQMIAESVAVYRMGIVRIVVSINVSIA